jgi:glycogen debranching enzyme
VAINDRLWDAQTGFYYDLQSSGAFVPYKSYSGLIPLIAGVVPAERIPVILAALRDPQQFLSAAGIRSMSAASPLYVPGEAEGVNTNSRGPVWLAINCLLVDDLADLDPPLAQDLRERIVGSVEADWRRAGRLHEYFDGDTGAGLGADSHAGSTALVANLIAEGWPAAQP